MARCGSNRNSELRETWSIRGGQRRPTANLEQQLEARFGTRAVVCGNQQKRKALASGAEHTLETFAPAAGSVTFKLLCAVGCVANLRVRQFDVEAAYIQGTFEGDGGEVFVRPPPDEHFFDDR
eukprot:2880777-Pleurochrysis_carterae.AAC.1